MQGQILVPLGISAGLPREERCCPAGITASKSSPPAYLAAACMLQCSPSCPKDLSSTGKTKRWLPEAENTRPGYSSGCRRGGRGGHRVLLPRSPPSAVGASWGSARAGQAGGGARDGHWAWRDTSPGSMVCQSHLLLSVEGVLR